MIASSGMAKSLAVSLAVAVHGAAVAVVFTPAPVEIEGDAGGTAASIGSSFAEMAAGVMTPEATEEVAQEVPLEQVTSQKRPDGVTVEDLPEEIVRDNPEETVQDRPHDTLAKFGPQETARPVEQSEAASVAPAEIPAKPAPASVEAQPVARVEVMPLVPLLPATPSKTAPEQSGLPVAPRQSDTLEPVDEAPTAVTRSLRPKPRSAAFEKAHKPAPPQATPRQAQPKPKRTAQPKAKLQPKGNAQQNARPGTATGTQTAKKSASQGSGQAAASGNAAASNYPGQVMRKISRVPLPRVGARGTAVVTFRIASNGGLAGVSIARSSGSTKLDQAALRMIQRAAPFPPPPAGARRSFSINVKGG